MVNYNQEDSLPVTLDSLLNQKIPPEEILVLDDGSTDKSQDILKSYENKESNISVMFNERNQGILISLNKLLAEVKTDFFQPTASDNNLNPNFLEMVSQVLQQEQQIHLAFGQSVYLDSEDQIITKSDVPDTNEITYFSPREFRNYVLEHLYPVNMSPASTIIRTKTAREFGGFRYELKARADNVLVRSIGAEYGGVYIPTEAKNIYRHQDGYSQTTNRNLPTQFNIISRSVWLRKNGDLSGIFDDEEINQWETRAKKRKLETLLSKMNSEFYQSIHNLYNVFSTQGLFSKIIGTAFMETMEVFLKFLKLVVNTYRADLSMYNGQN